MTIIVTTIRGRRNNRRHGNGLIGSVKFVYINIVRARMIDEPRTVGFCTNGNEANARSRNVTG